MRLTLLGVLTALLGALLAAPPPPAAAAGAATAAGARATVVAREVVFELENTNATSVLCVPDNQSYEVRGRLVGPRPAVLGHSGPIRINVLVHDLAAGSWFWSLPGHPAYDYARQLARRGETSLVLDRLGYGASPLANGDATCLGAQADMLHQVVQHVRSGRYTFAEPDGDTTPAAAHVVTHGHSVGAAIAQIEAATFDDVDGLVLMSWTDRGATSLATRTAARQSAACLSGPDYAPLTRTGADYRKLMFASAPSGVQRTAARLRVDDPCGDVSSLSPMLVASNLAATQVDAPVLLLYGAEDALNRPAAREQQAAAYPTPVTTRTFAGAGSALPLERSADKVRAAVLRWLRS
ncbi:MULTISPECIES: alpha/beta hydrolase [unclassified Nocardioides]|uniref:alpha/beta hydrolase n=1 Tax=unclassified Nocardioides TaxID=2615069 RepID=UPI001123E368|nr:MULTISPECIES: alpha/beta hydrolase [unclassified Nocardioides]